MDNMAQAIEELTGIINSIQEWADKYGDAPPTRESRLKLITLRSSMVETMNKRDAKLFDDLIRNADLVRMKIAERHAGDPAQDIIDRMPCPVCEVGTVHYRVSGLNGHIGARCTTNKCVNFQE